MIIKIIFNINFKKEILEICESEKIAFEREKFYIAKVKAYSNDKYYNISSGGEGGFANFAGKSQEELELWKKRMSESRKGRVITEGWKQKILDTRKLKGIGRGSSNPMYGKKGRDNPASKAIVMMDLEGNVVKEFDIPSGILNSILNYNTKELDKGTISRPIQKFFYVDEKGAITFTTGACVNRFELAEPVKILLNKRLVKLFKLFQDCSVHFKLAYDAVEGSSDIIQTKVQFAASDIVITSILSCDDSMLSQIPVNAIRGRADNIYPYSVVLSKNDLMATLGRLMLFTSSSSEIDLKQNIMFVFGPDNVTVSDIKGDNKEVLKYLNKESGIVEEYKANLDTMDLKLTLDTCVEPSITLSFGDGNAFILSRGSIKNVIPEVVIM